MYRAILFDFDGTLVNDLSFFIEAYDYALQKFGIHLNPQEIPKVCFHKSEDEVARNLKIPSGEEFSKYYFEGVDKFINDVPFFPGVEPLLENLKDRHLKLGVITLAKKWYIEKMIKQTGLNKYFQSVISCDDVKNPKPDPESVNLACKNLNVSPQDTLFVGDARGDILMGKSAGCKTALFLPTENESFYDFEILKRTNPDYIFYNDNELRKILL